MLEQIKRDVGPFLVAEGDYDENLYYRGMLKGAPYFYCHVQLYQGMAYVHAYAAGFGAEALRELRRDFRVVKWTLRLRGVQLVLGLVPTTGEVDLDRWTKFVRLLGFASPTDIMVGETPCKRVMMEV